MKMWLRAAATTVLLSLSTVIASAQEEVVVYYYSISPSQAAAMDTLIGKFEGENPDIRIRAAVKNYRTLNAEIKTALVANQPPDIGMIVTQSIADMVENAKAVPFDALPSSTQVTDRFFPTLRALGDYRGKTYLMPFAHGLALLYYNKDLMTQAGLDPNSPPRNWNELIEAARAIQDETGKYGMFAFHAESDFNAQTILIAGGAKIYDEATKRFVFDSPEGIQAMQTWQDGIVKYKLQPLLTSGQSNAAFANGELGFLVTTSGMLGSLSGDNAPSFDLGVTTMPTLGSDPLRVPNSGAGLMIFAQDPERQQRAFKFLEFMSRTENSNFWSMSTGYMPTALDPMADPAMQEHLNVSPLYGVLIKAMPTIVPKVPYPGDRSADLQNLMTTLLADIIANKGTAAELVTATVKQMNDVLAQSNM